MTTPPKQHPKRWTPADEATFEKAIRKALPPSPMADELGHENDTFRSPVRDSKRSSDPANKSSFHRPQKKG